MLLWFSCYYTFGNTDTLTLVHIEVWIRPYQLM